MEPVKEVKVSAVRVTPVKSKGSLVAGRRQTGREEGGKKGGKGGGIEQAVEEGRGRDPYALMINVIACNKDVQAVEADCHRQLMSPSALSVVCLFPGAFGAA